LNKLVYWRGVKGLTVRELAKKAGVSPNTISVIEQEKRKGSLVVLGKLAKALEVDLVEFIDLLEDPKELPVTVEATTGRHSTTRSGDALLVGP